jgi:hypothetical protein
MNSKKNIKTLVFGPINQILISDNYIATLRLMLRFAIALDTRLAYILLAFCLKTLSH